MFLANALIHFKDIAGKHLLFLVLFSFRLGKLKIIGIIQITPYSSLAIAHYIFIRRRVKK